VSKTNSYRFSLFLALFALCSGRAVCQKQVTYIQVVKQAATSVSLASSAGSISPGQQVQFTASIAPTKPTYPTGGVVFTATGSNPANVVVSSPIALGGSSAAVWATSIAAIDTYSVVAAYSGGSNYLASHSVPVLLSVTGSPDFTLSTPNTSIVVQGNSVAIPITVTSINGFAGTIAFECNGIPNSSTCSFSQGSATLAPSGPNSATTTLTLATAGTRVATLGILGLFVGWGWPSRKRFRSHFMIWMGAAFLLTTVTGCIGSNRYVQSNGTPVGVYSLTIVATSGAISHSSTVSLHVVAQ
jgi:type IV secretory pathway protease TraF